MKNVLIKGALSDKMPPSLCTHVVCVQVILNEERWDCSDFSFV